jgi:beta-glucosidase
VTATSALLCAGIANAVAHAADPARARAEKLVASMTQAEKFGFFQGSHNGDRAYVGIVTGVPRLGIPDLRLNDGPEGFRDNKHPGTSTQWPSGLTVAHSWDPAAFGQWGAAMGAEFAGKGANVLYGPAVNVARIANGGRSFEYLSGEDPFLGYTLVQPMVAGIQKQGVIANAKHYIDNNQEGLLGPRPPYNKYGRGDRHSTSSEVSERVNMELYFPPFSGAVEAGVLSVMCGNNLVNGLYACESEHVMTTMLREYGGFAGWACSDYDGTRSTVDAANNGLEIAMPGAPNRPDYFGADLLAAVAAGTVSQATIDEKATRVVYSMAALGILDTPNNNTADMDVTSPAHAALARHLSAASTTLLKNEGGLLPLLQNGLTIGLIGAAAINGTAIFGGDGSGKVTPKSAVTIEEALKSHFGAAHVRHAKDGANAAAVAAAADVAIVVLAQTSTEGHDRANLTLFQSELVPLAAAANKNTIVVTISPGPYLTAPWLGAAAALLDMGLPGEQEGSALVDVLTGAVNPAGRMPHTLPNVENEVRMTEAQYPGTPPNCTNSYPGNCAGTGSPPACGDTPDPTPAATGGAATCVPTYANYTEGLEVGYRWYDAHGVTPAFAFGHGLSYTTFGYSGLSVGADRAVSATVTNTGKVRGAEVAQLYLRYPEAAGEPFKQLRGFQKVMLEPGATAIVHFALPDRWLSTWDEGAHAWKLARGTFAVHVGASVADIRLSSNFTVE